MFGASSELASVMEFGFKCIPVGTLVGASVPCFSLYLMLFNCMLSVIIVSKLVGNYCRFSYAHVNLVSFMSLLLLIIAMQIYCIHQLKTAAVQTSPTAPTVMVSVRVGKRYNESPQTIFVVFTSLVSESNAGCYLNFCYIIA